ncbi:hypothetical protein KY359_03995, partial [Candidatus Woesearchaeota archaeon]|nr:hypothetical protein [Candidatus Woesearchaeota archaeon]
MVNEYDRDIERAKKKNLVVYLNGLQDPYFFGEDNTGARWNNADIGKFFAVTAMTLPLDLRVDNINGYWGRIADAAKTAVQEHFRTEAYNLLKTIEHYRKPREESVAMVMSPFRLVEYGAEKVAAYMRNAEQAYPKIFLEDIVHSALALSHGTEPGEEDTDKQIHLLDTVGLAAKKGAQEYVR